MPSLLPACTSVSLDAESAPFSSTHLAECRPDPRQELRVCSVTAGVGPKEKLLSGPGRPAAQTHPPSVPLCRLLASHPPADLCQPELPGDLSVYIGSPSSNLRHQAKGLKRDPAPPHSLFGVANKNMSHPGDHPASLLGNRDPAGPKGSTNTAQDQRSATGSLQACRWVAFLAFTGIKCFN